MSTPVVQLQNITKSYQTDNDDSYVALSDINLTINKGDFVAIIGPSGSGKSTLMNIIGLLDHPTSGTYILNNQNVAHLGETSLAKLRNQNIGFIFQNFNLLNRTSALQNVALPLVYRGVSQKERLRIAKNSLESVGLGDKLNNRPSQLSGGQQQRVAIARSLVTDPEIILADEPTGNLDSKTGDEIMKILTNLNKAGRTIVMITHSPDIAQHVKKQFRIIDGKIIK
jgi:putative ABC transport system ATP-binding protein